MPAGAGGDPGPRIFQSGMAQSALVIGTETLSRVSDMYDRDSMIFSDGAGASPEYKNANHSGVPGYSVQSHCMDEAYPIWASNFPHSDPRVHIKCTGRTSV